MNRMEDHQRAGWLFGWRFHFAWRADDVGRLLMFRWFFFMVGVVWLGLILVGLLFSLGMQ